jgi:MFS family permease
VGAAVIFPLSMALATIAFPPEQKGMALGIYGAIGTSFLALGPMTGGFFTDVLSWRWIFWINIPVILAVFWIIARGTQRQEKPKSPPRFDFPGLATLVCGLTALVLALMEGPGWGWYHPAIIGLLAASIVLIAGFIVIDSRVADPLVEIDLFRNPNFAVCTLVIFMAQFSKMAVIVFGAVYLQERLHFSPFLAGLALLVAVGPYPFLAGPSGYLTDRFGPQPLMLSSLVLGSIGLAWIGLTVSADSYLLIAPGLLIWGCGVIFMFAPPRSAMMKMVPPEKHGQIGGIAMSGQLVGGTIGMAVCSMLFSMTRSFAAVFLVNAAIIVVVLIVAWWFVDRDSLSRDEEIAEIT